MTLNDSNLRKYLITENQWNEFTKIQNFLQPFKEVTTIMSGFTYPTISATIPLYNYLIDHVEDVIGNGESDDNISESESIATNTETESNATKEEKWSLLTKQASKKSKEKLLEYYNKTNDSYLISIILDPRLKLQYFQDHLWGEQLISEVQQKLVYHIIILNNNCNNCINFVN